MSSSYITLPYHIISFSYHIISHVLLFYLFCWFDLYSIHSILLYCTLFQIDSIWFFSLLLITIYCIVQYSISYQWMICVYLSVRLWDCLSVCLSVWISLCFHFSFFSLYPFSLFSWTSSSHKHGHGHTNTYEYMFLLMTRTYYFKRM